MKQQKKSIIIKYLIISLIVAGLAAVGIWATVSYFAKTEETSQIEEIQEENTSYSVRSIYDITTGWAIL